MRCSALWYASLTFLLLLIAVPTLCLSWQAQVLSVSDGDTITVLHQGHQEKIRLYGIDAPEKDQEFGQKAKEMTQTLIAGRSVEVTAIGKDHYGRTIGQVTVDGQRLGELLIQNGYAWVYRQYCKERFCEDWISLEADARQIKKGLWAGSNIVPPWEWRHQPIALTKSNTSSPATATSNSVSVVLHAPAGNFRCDGRTRCSQMASCEEAKFFLKNCPGAKMDGDNDGVPCEKLCR